LQPERFGTKIVESVEISGESMSHASPQWGPILIVDDDARMRALVAALLEEAGYATICVETGEDALLAASRSSLSAAVLDVNLVGLSGYEVCHELRRRHGGGLPIIFISGDRTEPFDRAAGMLLGANDYLVKPFEPSELVARVNAAIERAEPQSRRGVLTAREHQILELLASGLAQGAIADRLHISPRTVATHIERILAKLGVRSRAEAVALAYRDALVPAP
jgi:DNA-binding NarL/FixJ family response regulator